MNEYLLDGKLVLSNVVKKRFLSKFKKVGKCWLWTGAPLRDGYGQFQITIDGVRYKERAHRLSFYIHRGIVPEGLLICHECDTPLCVNPSHLILGDFAFNAWDRERKMRSRPQSGGQHWSRRCPEKVARGDRSGVKRHPESYRGERHSQAKLTEEQVKLIRRLYDKFGVPRRFLAKKFGLSRGNIDSIVTRKLWKHI